LFYSPGGILSIAKPLKNSSTEPTKEKLAPYGTDSRLFATDVSAKFTKTRRNMKIRPDQI